jgi:hypothetical protein
MFKYFAIVTGLVLIAASPAFAERDFDAVVRLAASNAEAPAGQSYAPKAASRYASDYAADVSECLQSYAGADSGGQRIVVRIEETGLVDQIWHESPSGADACIAGVLENRSFGEPPFAPFHVLLGARSS